MALMHMIPAAAWVAYRQARRQWYTVLGRNPLVQGAAAPNREFELRSVRGLRKNQAHLPVMVRTDESQFTLWNTLLGEIWTPPGANAHFVGMLVGEMSAQTYDTSSLPKGLLGCTVVDAGSNVGIFSRWAFLQGAERVICFEPSPQTAECLRRNLAPEIAQGRVHIVQKGLWDSSTTLSFNSQNLSNPGGHHIVEDGSGSLTIPVTTLDEVFSELAIDRLDYVKMDIEGAEQRAILGAQNTLRKFRPQVCIATEHTDDILANAEDVIDKMRKLNAGYSYRVTEAHSYQSPSRGTVLVPYSILFLTTATT